MRKLKEKLKDRLRGDPPGVSVKTSGMTTAKLTTEETISRFRKQRGVNLGSWFVLERWIADSPFRFAHAPGQSDLDLARGENTRQTLEEHWDTWIKEEDWIWLVESGINAVRIPIGYYHLCRADPSVLTDTPFHNFEYVFSGAWARVTRAIETANQHGIGVLLDLHAPPGKRNNDPHAGTSDPPAFFSSKHHRKHIIRALRILLSAPNLSPRPPNIIGIELLNEPSPPSQASHRVLKDWYTSAILELRALDPSTPLYVGDCWRPDEYAEFTKSLPRTNMEDLSLVVLDHHLYRCFTASDINTPADRHAQALSNPGAPTPQTFARVGEKLGRASCGSGLVIGEWSGALNPRSFTGNAEETKRYIEAPLGLYEKTCAGWFFWTFRQVGARDVGWSFRDAVQSGTFPDFVGLKVEEGGPFSQVNSQWERTRREKVRDAGRDKDLVSREIFVLALQRRIHPRMGSRRQVNELEFKGAWAKLTTRDYGERYWEYERGFAQAVGAGTRNFQSSYS